MTNVSNAFTSQSMELGEVCRRDEDKARTIMFDCGDILAEKPECTILCAVQRVCDVKAYLHELTADGTTRTLVLDDGDLAATGRLKIELRAQAEDWKQKSPLYSVRVLPSLRGNDDKPGDPVHDILDRLDTEITKADTAAANAQSVADTVQQKLDAGELNGKDGADGADGSDGISPTVSVFKVDGVTTVTITDKDGTHTAEIADGAKGDTGATGPQGEKGEKGDTGATGAAGADGYSPTATVTKSGDTATITVTDKSGTTTAEVKDGSDASVTRDNVVSALGYTPEKQPDTWTFIETTTLTEETTWFNRTAKPDGTAYKLKRLHIIVESPSGITTKVGGAYYVYCKDGTAVYAWEDNLIQTTEGRQAILLAEINRDTLTVANEWRVKQELWNTSTLKWTYGIITEGTWMHSFSINAKLPVGTKITIYGVEME